jgi:hypothetical protein
MLTSRMRTRIRPTAADWMMASIPHAWRIPQRCSMSVFPRWRQKIQVRRHAWTAVWRSKAGVVWISDKFSPRRGVGRYDFGQVFLTAGRFDRGASDLRDPRP